MDLSIRVITILSNSLQFVQVNFGPTMPKSKRFSLFKKLLKFIFLRFAGLPPNFSFGEEMLLKSPITSQGGVKWLANLVRLSQSFLLVA